jgi:hypothetical protein
MFTIIGKDVKIMFQPTKDWNPKQALLREIILKPDRFDEAIQLIKDLHSTVHTKSVYGKETETRMDEAWEGLDDHSFRTMPTIKDDTFAWDIWHITRIEDLTANILIQKDKQVLDADWLKRLQTEVKDTGNAMSDEEILSFSNEVSMEGLFEYRKAVGIRTKEIIENMYTVDMKRKVSKEGIARILEEGGVTRQENSIWLLDFWGRKNIAGLFLMPITRHQIGHINDSIRLKEKCRKMFQ